MGNSRSGDSLPRNNVLPREEWGQSWEDIAKNCTNHRDFFLRPRLWGHSHSVSLSVHALFVTYWPLWQRGSGLCANCVFNMLMATSLSMGLPCLTTVGQNSASTWNQWRLHLRARSYAYGENLPSKPEAHGKLSTGLWLFKSFTWFLSEFQKEPS